jgi:hypothetical protein
MVVAIPLYKIMRRGKITGIDKSCQDIDLGRKSKLFEC